MAIIIQNKGLEAFAMILDINGYAIMTANPDVNSIAQFTQNILCGGINAVEKNGGEVVGFMGDAFFAILQNSQDVFNCCVAVAKDVDNICEYISNNATAFPFCPKGPSLKMGIEYGYLDVSDIYSNFLGKQKLFSGQAINYAARITKAGIGNRCLVGPKAYEMGIKDYISNEDCYEIDGKVGESIYKYYKLDLSDIWIEGNEEESFWG